MPIKQYASASMRVVFRPFAHGIRFLMEKLLKGLLSCQCSPVSDCFEMPVIS
jgi:hypothetical protein